MSVYPVWVGTSGWVYPDWAGTVYPQGMKSAEAFGYYTRYFQTVELNSTFYHFPRESTVEKWQGSVPDGFVWAVKVWRRITHFKRLHGVKKEVQDFFTRISPLVKQGVCLVQLPPSMKKDLCRLKTFLKVLPASFRVAVEFRHNSWFSEDTYQLLRDFSVCLAGVDAPRITRVVDIETSGFAYFRLHGRTKWYDYNYTRDDLMPFVEAVKDRRKRGDVFVYFDNTAYGQAFRNALDFTKELCMKCP
ncbi:MAG: DUF72 domain-containing protein [Candidatus Omnitrophica bacterium]|nr:DUF72 domain-containing protein [Candidatus Omnitrophota bacterium]